MFRRGRLAEQRFALAAHSLQVFEQHKGSQDWMDCDAVCHGDGLSKPEMYVIC